MTEASPAERRIRLVKWILFTAALLLAAMFVYGWVTRPGEDSCFSGPESEQSSQDLPPCNQG